MSALLVIGLILGTLVFAWAFDKFFGLIFREKPPKDSIEYLQQLIRKKV